MVTAAGAASLPVPAGGTLRAVTLAICGQAARVQHDDASMFMPETQMNLSGIVTFRNLQTRGYARIGQ